MLVDDIRALPSCDEKREILAAIGQAEEISALEALNLNTSAWSRLWLAMRNDFFTERKLRLMASDFANESIGIFERGSQDQRPRTSMNDSARFARGEIDDATRRGSRKSASDAAWASADSATPAESAAANAAALASAWDSAGDAAMSAARDASNAAAWDAGGDFVEQKEIALETYVDIAKTYI
jgi:hypothetical protein